MQPIKIEGSQTLSRKDAAAWVSDLAEQLASGDEVELELEEGRTELEIELHW